MRNFTSNTVVVKVDKIEYREVACVVPDGLKLDIGADRYEGWKFLYLDDSSAQVLKSDDPKMFLREDCALLQGAIKLAENPDDCNIRVRLPVTVESYVECDIPEGYIVGYIDGKTRIRRINVGEKHLDKWPVQASMTVQDALAKGILKSKREL